MLPLLPAEIVANAALLQIGYGATIASFLGGIHWAMAMAEYGGVCVLHLVVNSQTSLPLLSRPQPLLGTESPAKSHDVLIRNW